MIKMISNYTILTIPQWSIFAGITVMVYGWAEHKRVFGFIGSGIFVCLGIYAAIAIASGAMMPAEMLDMTDPLSDTPVLAPDEIPMEGRLLPFYWMLVCNGGLALIALFAEIFKKRFANPLKIATAAIGIVLFFLMMGALKA